MPRYTPHEKMVGKLIEDGLVVRDGARTVVTPKGDEYTRALIKAYPNINKPRRGRPRKEDA